MCGHNGGGTLMEIADLHCHPNLKTFGYSLNKTSHKKANLKFQIPNNWFYKFLNKITGLCLHTQIDFAKIEKANVKLAFVSYYPFEKGFFIHKIIPQKMIAFIGGLATGIGYKRIRQIQQHCDYFTDLKNEIAFFEFNLLVLNMNSKHIKYVIPKNQKELNHILENPNLRGIIPSIEGAHVFNSGLSNFNKPTNWPEFYQNLIEIKKSYHPPMFITLAHNFNNDLCGHAPSLERLGGKVDQSENLNKGLFLEGIEAIRLMLDKRKGARILIDVKHMSIAARKQYYSLLNDEYNNEIPVVASHCAVAGQAFDSKFKQNNFCSDDINLFDEEIIYLAKTHGIMGLQMDRNRLGKTDAKLGLFPSRKKVMHYAADIIWEQIKYIAELLDRNNLNAWDCVGIGSDFDGSIKPLPGVWSVLDFEDLRKALSPIIDTYLAQPNPLQLESNKTITAEVLLNKFFFENTRNFLISHFKK